MDTRVIAAVVIIVGLSSVGAFVMIQSPAENIEENQTTSQTGANETVKSGGSNQATQDATDTPPTASRLSQLTETVNSNMSNQSYSASFNFDSSTGVVQRHTDVYDPDANVVRRTGRSTFGVSVNKTYLLDRSEVHDLEQQTVSEIGETSQVRVHPVRLRTVENTTVTERSDKIRLTTSNRRPILRNGIPDYVESSQVLNQTVVVSASSYRIERASVTVGTDETTLTAEYTFSYDETAYQLRTIR